jgi:hypothetical protein
LVKFEKPEQSVKWKKAKHQKLRFTTTTSSQLKGRSEGGVKHRAKVFAILEGRPEDGRQCRKVGAKVGRPGLQAGGQVGPS